MLPLMPQSMARMRMRSPAAFSTGSLVVLYSHGSLVETCCTRFSLLGLICLTLDSSAPSKTILPSIAPRSPDALRRGARVDAANARNLPSR